MSPDRSLIRRVAAGDPDAVDRWYREHYPDVYRLCLGFLAHGAEAEDVAQDAMLHMIDRLQKWDERQAFRSWRNAVVLNLCRDRRRRAVRQRDAEQRALQEGLHIGAASPAPDQAMRQVELRAMLERTLSGLPEREREAFVLRDLEGVATADAARAMGVAESSVRSLTTLARRRLRGLLATMLPTGEPT